MKKLITLNFLAAFLLCAVMITSRRFDDGILLLLGMILLFLFCALAIGNLVAIFHFWKRHRFRAFLPIISYALAATLFLAGVRVGSRIVILGTPSSPDSFLDGKTRKDLAEVANSLLGQSFKKINTFSANSTEVIGSRKQLPPGVEEKLRAYGFQRTLVDDSQSLVVFCYGHQRTWYEYLYTTKDFPPLYSRPVAFTEIDIENWSELLRISKQGPSATDNEKMHIVFSPSVVYPYLQKTLGDDILTKLRSYTSSDQILPEQKVLVLDALNQQRRLASRLVENPGITFDKDDTSTLHISKYHLHLGGCEIGDSFWVTSLIKQLLDRGVLLYADDGRHLKIKVNPSPEETLNIEWVHVGLMDFLYGNLVDKREYAYTRSLGGGWYYNER